MFAEQIREAVLASPRERLAQLAGAVWKGHAAGAIGDDEAQQLAELIEARKAVPIAARPQRRRVGSRPRTPESMARRRRLVSSGWLPPQIASAFTMAEAAVLAVIAQEVIKGRDCRLTIGHIAALAGCCKQTVRNAVRHAEGQGLLVSQEWRLSAFRSAPNHVKIVAAEWLAWLRLASRRGRVPGGASKFVERTPTVHRNPVSELAAKRLIGERTAKTGPAGARTYRSGG